jgi:hypothetical protein
MKNLLLTAAAFFGFAAASMGQTLPNYLPADGLVGWWPFNGNANDESGNANNGVVNGAALTNDRFTNSNSAYNFDGNDDVINIPNNFANQIDSVMSISMWYKMQDNTDHQSLFLREGYNFNGSKTWILSMDGENYFRYYTDCCTYTGGSSGSSLYDSWQNIVVVFSNYNVKSYINGVLVSNSNLSTPFAWSPQPILIGESAGTGNTSYPFLGQIDDIGIYNRALSQEEITALYTGEPVNPPTTCNPLPANLQNGLVGYWPLCGNANDESGNGNDGVVDGAALTNDRFANSNSAYNFDGNDDVINIPNNFANQIDSVMSISMWYKMQDNTDHQSLFLREGYNFNGSKTWILSMDGENYFRYYTDCCTYTGGSSGSSLYDSWQNIVVVFSNFNVKSYINGVLVSNSNLSTPFAWSPEPILIGESAGTGNTSYPFLGQIDDIGIWNRALTVDEVQQLYTNNACTFTVYDTLTIENVVNVYDTTTVIETLYDTVTVVETLYETVYDTVLVSTTDTLIINTLITAVQPAQENTFLVYPNPAGSQITINNGNVGILGGYTMRITNSAGQEVYNQNITQTEVTLGLSTWGGNGLYVLYILDPQGEIIAVKQIVLQ